MDATENQIERELIAKFASQPTGKAKMSRNELVCLIRGHSNLMEQSDDIVEYVDSLKLPGSSVDDAIPCTTPPLLAGQQLSYNRSTPLTNGLMIMCSSLRRQVLLTVAGGCQS